MSYPDIPDDVLDQLARAQRVSTGELDALKLALTERKSRDIAQELGISEAATRKRLGEVYRKFDIKGRGPGKLAALIQRLVAEAKEKTAHANDRVVAVAPSESKTGGLGADVQKHRKQEGIDLKEIGLQTSDTAFTLSEYCIPENPHYPTRYCWNNAPPLHLFQGRRETLKHLKQWILQPVDSSPATLCKVLAVCGIGGIGKTSTVLKLIQELEGRFEQVIWLSVRSAQKPTELLQSLLNVLPVNGSKQQQEPEQESEQEQEFFESSENASASIEKSSDELIEEVIQRISMCRCLIVLDGLETVFKSYHDSRTKVSAETSDSEEDVDISATRLTQKSGLTSEMRAFKTPTFEATRHQQASLYQNGLKAYGRFLTALRRPVNKASARGMSCLIVTSREKPREISTIPTTDSFSYLYTLDGLKDHEVASLLRQFHLQGSSADFKELSDRYYGHPMALRLAANAIKDVFYGRIRDFLDQEISVFDDLRSVLKTQFRRLSPLETEVMYWLAINHVPCTLEDLQSDLVSQDHKENVLYTLQSLERRFLVEVKQGKETSFRLHPIVAEYVVGHFVRKVFEELIHDDFGNLSLFNCHALMKADAQDFCRQFQKDAIVHPILERLRNYLKSLTQVDVYLNKKLDAFREKHPHRLGYAGGNFINLMVELSQGKLFRKDFSELTIWQAYLQGTQLREVNFNRCELNRSVFTETLSDVLTVALSAATNRFSLPLLAGGDTNGRVHLWLTGTLPQAGETGRGALSEKSAELSEGQKCAEWSAHNGWVRSLAFIPNLACMVTGGDDSKLKLWQLPTFAQSGISQVRQLWQQNVTDWVHAIAVSGDGKTIASGGETHITLHRATDGAVLCRFPYQPGADGSQVGTETMSPETIGEASALTRQGRVRSLTFSPDGQWLVSGGDDHLMRLWSVRDLLANAPSAESESGLAPTAVLTGHTDWVRSVRFTPDSQRLLSGSDDGTVRLWSLETFHCVQVLRQSSDRVRSIAVSPDARFLAAGGDDCTVRLWDLQSYQILDTMSVQRSRIWSVAFGEQNGRLSLCAGGDKQTLMLWQIQPSGAKQLRTYRGYTDGIRTVGFLGDQHIVSGGDSQDLAIWERKTGENKATLSLHQGRIWAIALDTPTARIASAGDDHTIRLWDANTGQCLTTFTEHTSWVRTVAFSHRGRFLASSGDDSTIRIWNTTSGFCLNVLQYSAHWIHSVSFDPTNSRYLVSGGDDQIVRCWDRKERLSWSLAVHDRRICSVAYSPKGDLIASGSDDNTVILWDVAAQSVRDRFTQPELGIKSVAFSPDGRYLAAGGEDQLVYLWDLEAPGSEAIELKPQSYTGVAGGIRSVAFSPDSSKVISGGLDATIRIADLTTLQTQPQNHPVLRPLIQPERPYEQIEISDVKGLSKLQVSNLLSLGAINRKTSLFS